VPVGATGRASAPHERVRQACLDRDLVPLILGNRIHVAPPLNLSDADAATGLAILDEDEADKFLARMPTASDNGQRARRVRTIAQFVRRACF
jgi:hypothetical protein